MKLETWFSARSQSLARAPVADRVEGKSDLLAKEDRYPSTDGRRAWVQAQTLAVFREYTPGERNLPRLRVPVALSALKDFLNRPTHTARQLNIRSATRQMRAAS